MIASALLCSREADGPPIVDEGLTPSSPEELVAEARNGRMVVLVDDGEGQGKASLVLPAQLATPLAINFMAKHGRGLVCLALTEQRVRELALPLISPDDECRHDRAFTVSIEAREGISTGISAADRARTIATAIDIGRGRDTLVTPGHVFPLVARAGGVLMRAGHTEAAVDLARLAGLNPSGVICEIMDERGMNARSGDLHPLARHHRLKIGTIRDLIAYRSRHDPIVEKTGEMAFESRWGGAWSAVCFANRVTGVEQLALLKGPIDPAGPVPVRIHAANIFRDLLAGAGAQGDLVERSMREVAAAGSGLVIILSHAAREWLSPSMQACRTGMASPRDAASNDRICAQILAALGVRELILLAGDSLAGATLADYGLCVVEERRMD